MKKFMLSLAVVAAIGFTSCSSDDDKGGNDDGCQTCAAYEVEVNGETQTVPEVEVCENEEGNAVVAGQDTGQDFATYIDLIELVTTCE